MGIHKYFLIIVYFVRKFTYYSDINKFENSQLIYTFINVNDLLKNFKILVKIY